MLRKRHSAEEIIGELRRTDLLLSHGPLCWGWSKGTGGRGDLLIRALRTTTRGRTHQRNGVFGAIWPLYSGGIGVEKSINALLS